ncbi:MAG: MBL fold metallo-hydrolase [Eubacteriales bacterium]|nr:MBL fold metallo-hydrolase [Eubacteriales bacterium]MDD3881271.1 MBL fold metallo-hydrolase [Eubacteriales bacterium]MDD4512189.1 MBL fold metallo-hydrolase [Eubacteriales bacterium]
MLLRCFGSAGAFPVGGEPTTGYSLTAGDTELQLDFGSGVFAKRSQMCGEKLPDAILLSHLHFDHMCDLLPYTYFLQKKGAGISVPPMRLFLPSGSDAAAEALIDRTVFDVIHVVAGCKYSVGGLEITAAAGRHPAVSFMYKICGEGKSFVFTGDTNTAPSLEPFVSGSDILLCDACFTQEEWTIDSSHLSAFLAASLAKMSGVKRLLLTHFAPGSDRKLLLSQAARMFPAVTLMRSGETYEL